MTVKAQKPIVIFRGDNTAAFDLRTIRILLTGDLDLSHATAKFTLLDFSKTWTEQEVSTGELSIVFTAEQTKAFALGPQTGTLRLYDMSTGTPRQLTIVNKIPFFVTNRVCEIDSQSYEADVCVSGGDVIHIEFKVGTGEVEGKADKVKNATAGDLASLTADGNLEDSGIPKTDVLRKSQMDSTPTEGSCNPVTSDGIKRAIDAATPSDYAEVKAKVAANTSDIAEIESLIPAQASDQNKLADRNFVNSSIQGKYERPSGGIPKSDLSSAVQTSLSKADTALQTAPVTSVNSKTGAVTLTASDVGALGNAGNQTLDGTLHSLGLSVSNVADSNREAYLARIGIVPPGVLRKGQGKLGFVLGLTDGTDRECSLYIDDDGKVYINTPSGYVEVPNATNGGTLALTSDIPSVAGLAPLASPAFTGTPTAPTPTAGDDSTKVATTAFVQSAVSGKANTSDLRYSFNAATVQDSGTGVLIATGLADRANNYFTVPLGFGLNACNVTLPAATPGKMRDFYVRIALNETGTVAFTWIDPVTHTDAVIEFGEDSLADIDTGVNLILFTEIYQTVVGGAATEAKWLVSVKHEEAAS